MVSTVRHKYNYRRCRHCHIYFHINPLENPSYCTLACADKGPSYLPWQVQQFEKWAERDDERTRRSGRKRNSMSLEQHRRQT